MPTNSPQLTLPPGETIGTGGTIDVSGIGYADSFAAGNPGAMYLHIVDSAGLLSATNAAGVLVPGSGTNAITVSASYADITAVLASLTYAAPATAGGDSISFDFWNQAGVETTGSIPVTVGTGSGSGSGTETWLGSVSSNWNNGANWSTGTVPVSGDTIVIPGGTPNTPALSGATLTGEHITLADGGGQGGTVNFTNVTLGAGTTLHDATDDTLPAPGISLGGTFTIAPGASLTAGPSSLRILQSASSTAPAELVNQGTIDAGSGHVNIDTGGTVINDGLMVAGASGGIGFDLGQFTNSLPQDTILNNGTIEAAGGSIYINGTVHGGTLLYNGAGSLVLEQQNALADGATIAGFGANDTINLYLIQATGLSYANGVLSVMNGGTVVEALPMQGNYTTANFQMVFQPSEEFSNLISYVGSAPPPPPPSGPQIAAPASETVAAGGTIAVTGVSVADSFAASHPGTMALNVTDSSGTVRMTDGSGNALAGSGTGAIHYSGTLNQINAALATLSYTAGGSAGSDSISVDVWDQAGQEGTQPIAVTIGGGSTGGTTTGSGGDSTPPPNTGTDQTIVSSLNNATINAGSGNNTIFAGGSGDTITTGDGNNLIQAFAGGAHITTGSGNDTIRIAGTGSVVNAGGGANRIEDSGSGNTFVLPDAGSGSDDIYGYVLSTGDLFDLRGALQAAGWNGAQSSLGNYLHTASANGGADTNILVAAGGTGSGSVVGTVHGNGAVGLSDFLPHAVLT